MSLDAGSVYATLGGRYNPAGFHAFDRAMNNSHGRMNRFEAALMRSTQRGGRALHTLGTAAGYGAAGGVAALGVALVGTVKKAADFDAQMDAVGAAADVNGRKLEAMRKQALKAGADTKYSALEAAQAQEELAKGGLSVSKIMGGGLKGALALAAAGQLELAEAGATIANALGIFQLEGSQATHVADALASAANSTTADVGDFARALTQGGAAAKAAGLDLDQTVVMLEALARAGVKGSDAGTSMKAMLTQLASPTAKSKEAMKEHNLAFFDAQGNFKSLTAISAMLRKEMGDMTRQERLALSTTLSGTDGMRALLALYDAGPSTLRRYATGLERQGSAADMAAKKQDNLKGRIENMMGSLETAAIVIGTEVMPSVEKSVTKFTSWVNQQADSGALKRFGQDLADGFETGARAVPHVAHAIGDVAGAARDAYGVVSPLISLIGDIPDGALLGAAGGFAAFRVAGAVAPMVVGLASAIGDVVLALRAGGPLFAMSTMASMAGPVGLAAGAFVALGAAVGIALSAESREEQIAKRVAAAKREQAAAIRDLNAAEGRSVNAKLDAKQSTLDVKAAQKRVDELGKSKRGTDEYRQAVLDLEKAKVRSVEAHSRYNSELEREHKASVQVRREAAQRAAAAAKELEDASPRTIGMYGRTKETPVDDKRLAAARREYAAAMDAFVKANTRATIGTLNKQRLEQGQTRITQRNAEGFRQLAAVINYARDQGEKIPKRIETKILADDQGAVSKVGLLAGKLAMIGKTKSVAKILTNAPDAKSAVLALQGVLDGVPASKALKIVQNAPSAGAAVKAFTAIAKGVPASKVLKIIQNAPSARSAIAQLRAEIASLPTSKTVRLTTERITRNIEIGSTRRSGDPGRPSKRAAGRRSGAGEDAIVGEGSRWQGAAEWLVDPARGTAERVEGAQLRRLSPSTYVIPTEDRYRQRGIGLLAEVAKDLGLAMFAGGKKPKKKAPAKPKSWPVPKKVALGGVPFEDVEADYQKKRDAYQDAKKNVTSHEKQTSAAKHRLDRVPKGKEHARSRSNARDALKREERELRKARDLAKRRKPIFEKAEAYWKAAKKTDDQVKDLETDINLARDRMADANRDRKQGDYNRARTDRQTKLKELVKLLQGALQTANPLSDHARKLKERLSELGGNAAVQGQSTGFGGELGDPALSDEENDALKDEPKNEEAERVAGGGLTDAEQARLDQLELALARAEVDTPDDANDDRSVLSEIVRFREGVRDAIAANLGDRGGNSSLAAAIREVGSARQTLADRLSAGEQQRNSDVEAQLGQERRLREIAEEDARRNAAALTVLGPAGTAPQIVQNFNTLHPGDPRIQRALADTAAAGMNAQPARRSVRTNLGV